MMQVVEHGVINIMLVPDAGPHPNARSRSDASWPRNYFRGFSSIPQFHINIEEQHMLCKHHITWLDRMCTSLEFKDRTTWNSAVRLHSDYRATTYSSRRSQCAPANNHRPILPISGRDFGRFDPDPQGRMKFPHSSTCPRVGMTADNRMAPPFYWRYARKFHTMGAAYLKAAGSGNSTVAFTIETVCTIQSVVMIDSRVGFILEIYSTTASLYITTR
ncbi:hypothetical protein E1B28_002249 [Marasmius oreades]|uniref:Uncharacterized protein n=1 Tax=Marasmius oreades TaxID=181124 RepID=A0A9P7ULC9_9AGAR|nr:uncharacterized protein E1B28_002249 [Marasmius oreades]KAG7086285.1 hypothetical protein E1B28_002249 [Marasmius oreades]